MGGRFHVTSEQWFAQAVRPFCRWGLLGDMLLAGQARAGHERVRDGPLPWPQSAHISTVNRPPTLWNGPVVDPQKEQRSAIAPNARTGARWYGCTC